MCLLSKFIELNWQVISGISTTVIALCALALSIWQGMQTRKHNRLSVMPHLTTKTDRDVEKGFYSIKVINNGIGPALIEEFLVKVDGKVISGQGPELIEKVLQMLFPGFPYKSKQGYVSKDHSMAVKDIVTIVNIQFYERFPPLEFMDRASNRVSFDILYKSFYGKQFHLQFPTQDEKSNKQIQPTN